MFYLDASDQKTAKQVFGQIADTILKKRKIVELKYTSKIEVKTLNVDSWDEVKGFFIPDEPCKLHPRSLFFNGTKICAACSASKNAKKRVK